MPLKKSASNAAFSHNVEAERAAGKPQKQAVAIAEAVRRRAQGGPTNNTRKSGRGK